MVADEVTRHLFFDVQHEGVGITINTTIRLGDVKLISYHAGTRHAHRADEIAYELIEAVLRPLFTVAAGAHGLRPPRHDGVIPEADPG